MYLFDDLHTTLDGLLVHRDEFVVTFGQCLLQTLDHTFDLNHRSNLENTAEDNHVECLLITHAERLLCSIHFVDLNIVALILEYDAVRIVNQDATFLNARFELIELRLVQYDHNVVFI